MTIMKEYLEKRIKEVRKEKDMWLEKLKYNEHGEARLYYLECVARLNELVDLLSKMNRGDINE